jgi:RNA polymerase sigma-70 factor (ECF subfamily)
MRDPNKIGADEDYELVSRCKKGDTDAFEGLVVKHQKRMLNIAYRMIGNYEDACEVVQDSFVSAYRSVGKFQEKARFSTWLYAIVINLSRNRLKQLKTRGHHEGFSMDETVLKDEDSFHREVASDDPPVHEQLEKRELQQKVQGCIKALDAEYREVIVLRDIQGFAYDEIRDMLKVPKGTVKSRISRAREALKDCLKNVMGEL